MLAPERLNREIALIKRYPAFTGKFQNSRKQLFKLCIERAKRRASFAQEDLILEFGVAGGSTITAIANLVGKNKTVYGFDSFEGLPEEWKVGKTWEMRFKRKGAFSQGGKLPSVPENVTLIKGWFDETLAPFLEQHPNQNVGFLHVDSDLYSSAKTILTLLEPRMTPGMVIQFDQFYNFEGMAGDSEIRAFLEFIDETGHEYEYFGRTDCRQIALVITK